MYRYHIRYSTSKALPGTGTGTGMVPIQCCCSSLLGQIRDTNSATAGMLRLRLLVVLLLPVAVRAVESDDKCATIDPEKQHSWTEAGESRFNVRQRSHTTT